MDSLIYDIMLILPEYSGSTSDRSWIKQVITSLNSELISLGFVSIRYSILGYGGSVYTNYINDTYIGLSDIDSQLNNIDDLISSGSISDGYEAIKYAIQNVSFRSNSSKGLIFVTDKERSINDSISKSELNTLLDDNNIVASGFLKTNIISSSGNSALGYNSQDQYVIYDSGDYTTVDQNIVLQDDNIANDYGDIFLNANGSIWDMQKARDGGLVLSAFLSAYSEYESDHYFIANNDCSISKTPNLLDWFCTSVSSDSNGDNITAFYNYISSEVEALGDPEYDFTVESRENYKNVYFRIIFYANSSKTVVRNYSFSHENNNRWFIEEDGSLQSMPSNGVFVLDSGDTVKVVYQPKVLPSYLSDRQIEADLLDGSIKETPLMAGVTYYVVIEAYIDGHFIEFYNKEYLAKEQLVQNDIITDINSDNSRWISSGMGDYDTRITHTLNDCTFSNISSNINNRFIITWLDYRNIDKNKYVKKPIVNSSYYVSSKNRIKCSAQGYTDTFFAGSYDLLDIVTDNTQNFYSVYSDSSETKEKRLIVFVTNASNTAPSIYESKLDEITILTGLDSLNYSNIRVSDDSIVRSHVLSNSKVLPIVDKCVIGLDIIGIPNIFALRFRNENDSKWSGWKTIRDRQDSDFNFNSTVFPTSVDYQPFKVDKDRIIAPWIVSSGNGIKNTCCQVLTPAGLSNVFCTEYILNSSEIQYKIRLYSDNTYSSELNKYNNYYLVKKNSSGDIYANIYVELEFEDKEYYNKIKNLQNSFNITLNIIHEGIEDLYNISMSENSNGIMRGSFSIDNSDGVYFKDGYCSIIVNIESPCSISNSLINKADTIIGEKNRLVSGSNDYLNSMNLYIMGDGESSYQDIFNDINVSSIDNLKKVILNNSIGKITEYKNSYNKDDLRFVFGNPNLYRNKE